MHRCRRVLAALIVALLVVVLVATSTAPDPPSSPSVPPPSSSSSSTSTAPPCIGCEPVAPHGLDSEGAAAVAPQRAAGAVPGGGLSTSTLRGLYEPACRAKAGKYVAAYAALDEVLAAHHYKVRAADTGAYSCRRITGGTGYSLHAFGPGARFAFWCCGASIATSLAVDINWGTNPYGRVLRTDMPAAMVTEIEAIRTTSGAQVWRWGGRYALNKDPMHFEIVAAPADLATGIRPRSTAPAHVWTTIRPGADDRVRGGHDVAEVQWIRYALGDRISIDGIYGPASQASVAGFKADIIQLQVAAGQTPWPNTDPIVGPATIAMLRWWAAAA